MKKAHAQSVVKVGFWGFGSPRDVGNWSLFFGIMIFGIAVAMGDLTFRLISDPTITASHDSPDLPFYMNLFNSYFAFFIMLGLVLAVLLHQMRLRPKHIGIFLMCAPGIIVFSYGIYMRDLNSVYYFPFWRTFSFLMPLTGIFVLPLSLTFSPSLKIREAGIERPKTSPAIQALFVVLTAIPLTMPPLVERFLFTDRVIGSVVVYLCFLLLGLMALAGSVLHYRWCVHLKAKPAVRPVNSAKRAWANPKGNRTERGGSKPMVACAVAAILFFVIFLPPLEKVVAEPRLEINQAYGHPKYGLLEVGIVVVNRNGGTAEGEIALRISNDTINMPVANTSIIEGFGQWRVEKVIRMNASSNVSLEKLNLSISLFFKGKMVQKRMLKRGGIPCDVTLLFIAIVVTAIWLTGRRVRPGPSDRKRFHIQIFEKTKCRGR